MHPEHNRPDPLPQAGDADAIRIALACSESRCACRRPRTRTTHCPAHPDRRPSLGVDERGGRVLVICRAGCPQGTVVAALRERGLWPSASASHPHRPRSLLAEALTRVRDEVEHQRRRLEPCRDLFVVSDWLRPRHQTVAEAQQVATALGDTELAWGLLVRAAQVETEARTVEAELDDLLPLPRREDLDGPLGGGRP